MKFHVLALLPLGFVLSSCFPDPYYSQQGPPPGGYQQGGYGNGGPYNSYGGNGYRSSQPQPYDGYQQQGGGYQTEQGTYEQIGPRGATRQNEGPRPDVTSRPISPTYGDPDGGNPAPTPAPRNTGRQEYPTAERTDKPGLVRIPYPPYNIIDVNGIKSGGLAQDPTSGKKFRVP